MKTKDPSIPEFALGGEGTKAEQRHPKTWPAQTGSTVPRGTESANIPQGPENRMKTGLSFLNAHPRTPCNLLGMDQQPSDLEDFRVT